MEFYKCRAAWRLVSLSTNFRFRLGVNFRPLHRSADGMIRRKKTARPISKEVVRSNTMIVAQDKFVEGIAVMDDADGNAQEQDGRQEKCVQPTNPSYRHVHKCWTIVPLLESR